MAPRGPGPSWNRRDGPAVINDPGEAAYRPHEAISFHRTGSIIFGSSFESGLQEIELGTTGSYDIDNTISLIGAQSLKITTPEVISGLASIAKSFYLTESKIGLESAFMLNGQDNFEFGLFITYADANYEYNPEVFIHYESAGQKRLSYTVDGGGQIDLADLSRMQIGSPTWPVWHTLKMTFDPDTGKIEKIMLDQRIYRVDAIAFRNPALTQDYSRFWIKTKTLEAVAKTFFIDTFIITDNEP